MSRLSHSEKDLSRPLIRKILRDVDLTPEHYQEELKKL